MLSYYFQDLLIVRKWLKACASLQGIASQARSDVRASTWYADGRMFDDHVRQHSVVKIGHETHSTAVLALPLIQLLTKGTG